MPMHPVALPGALLLLLLLLLTAWKAATVARFFQRSPAVEKPPPALVSILQPILSGDPTLAATLAHNLQRAEPQPVEFLWLVDEEDADGQALCQALMDAHPAAGVTLHLLPRPPEGTNPKTFKLIAGLAAACGEILAVLDDDTMLPAGWQAECLPLLATPGVGLVFGLPYQVHFANFWSALVATFVNSSSLLTYIPYTALHEPVTINGMFYALRREVLDAIGGWQGIEQTLADDFAVAMRVRGHGYKLAQSPLRHAIATHVRDGRHYLALIQRWFIFPRESLLRHLPRHEQLLVYGLALFPALMPLAALTLVGVLTWLAPGAALLPALLLVFYLVMHFALFACFDVAYLHRATPWRYAWLVPLLQLLFPLQLLAALLLPQRITWRGHRMAVKKGGGFRYVVRREERGDGKGEV